MPQTAIKIHARTKWKAEKDSFLPPSLLPPLRRRRRRR